MEIVLPPVTIKYTEALQKGAVLFVKMGIERKLQNEYKWVEKINAILDEIVEEVLLDIPRSYEKTKEA